MIVIWIIPTAKSMASSEPLTRDEARRALARADRIMAVSHSSKRELSRVFDVSEEKIEVVHNAFDERFLREPMPEDADRILERHALRKGPGLC